MLVQPRKPSPLYASVTAAPTSNQAETNLTGSAPFTETSPCAPMALALTRTRRTSRAESYS